MLVDKPRQIYIAAKYGKGRTHTPEFTELKKKLIGFGFHVTNAPTTSHKFICDSVEAILASDVVVVAGKHGDYTSCSKAATEVGVAKWGGKKLFFTTSAAAKKDPDQFLFEQLA